MPPTSSSRGPAGRRSRLAWKALSTVVAVAAVCGIGVASSSAGPYGQLGHEFVTKPKLHPPKIDVVVPANGTGEGNILTTPLAPLDGGVGDKLESPGQGGVLISDNEGKPVWFKPTDPGEAVTDLQMQEYQGKPVLTWWEGDLVVPPGMGFGHGVIMDQSYREIATVRAGNGVQADIHDFQITPRNTALLVAYHPVPMDLTPFGGPKNGKVLENVVQEVDIASGEVLFDWRSLDHIGLDESYLPPPPDPSMAWDYLHVNSLEPDGGNKLLISARSTHALYQLNRSTGAVNWRLHGRKSDFELPTDAQFEWQHDARRLPDGTISLFDNAIAEKLRSRGVVLRVDEAAKTVETVRQDWRPAPLVSPNMGNYQTLDNGNGFLGWGGMNGITELGPDLSVRYEAQFAGGVSSYRAYREPWVGKPADAPKVAGKPGKANSTAVFASWNGATELESWRVYVGDDPDNLRPVRDVPKDGFETKMDISGDHSHVAVEALDANGSVIGKSDSASAG